jgi:hypothetical protein
VQPLLPYKCRPAQEALRCSLTDSERRLRDSISLVKQTGRFGDITLQWTSYGESCVTVGNTTVHGRALLSIAGQHDHGWLDDTVMDACVSLMRVSGCTFMSRTCMQYMLCCIACCMQVAERPATAPNCQFFKSTFFARLVGREHPGGRDGLYSCNVV